MTPGQRRAQAALILLLALDLLYSLASLFRTVQADRGRARAAQARADELMNRGPGEGGEYAPEPFPAPGPEPL